MQSHTADKTVAWGLWLLWLTGNHQKHAETTSQIKEELRDMSKILSTMTDNLRNLAKQQEIFIELMKEVKLLKQEKEEKEQKKNHHSKCEWLIWNSIQG